MISRNYNASTSDMKFCRLLMLNDFIVHIDNVKHGSKNMKYKIACCITFKSNDGFLTILW